MKKSLITLAVAAAVSGSVNAAEMYSLDGVTIDITGEVEAQYIKTQSETQNLELNIAEANIGLDVTYEMTEEFSVGTHIDFDGNGSDGTDDDDDTNTDVEMTRGDVYLSLYFGEEHTLSFGAQTTIMDDAGIGDDKEFGFTSFVGGEIATSGDQVVKYKYDGGEMLYAGIAYSANQNTSDSDESDDDYVLDAKVGVRIEDAELTLFVADAETEKEDRYTYALEGRYYVGDFGLAATYSDATIENTGAADTDVQAYGLAVSWWDGGRLEYAAGWANVDNDSNTDDINDYYVNVTYDFTDEVSAYAEVGFTDEDDTDTGYVIGMNATF